MSSARIRRSAAPLLTGSQNGPVTSYAGAEPTNVADNVIRNSANADKLRAALQRMISLRRFAMADDIPGVVTFLASDDPSFLYYRLEKRIRWSIDERMLIVDKRTPKCEGRQESITPRQVRGVWKQSLSSFGPKKTYDPRGKPRGIASSTR